MVRRVLGLALAVTILVSQTTTSGAQRPASIALATEAAPAPSHFYDSSFDVTPGSRVSLHWSPSVDLQFSISSSLPDFSSPGVVSWPPDTTPRPRWNGTSWLTTASSLTVRVPKGSAPGTHYTFALSTCRSAACSSRVDRSVVSITPSPTAWATKTYRADFGRLTNVKLPGMPFATTFQSANNSIWVASEFSHSLSEVKNGATRARSAAVTSRPGSSRIFSKPFADCFSGPDCASTSMSAMSESIAVSSGTVWLTFGGWRWQRLQYPQSTSTNRSEVVAFDPATKKFCTYLVPGNDNEVTGIAVTGAGAKRRVWFTESYGSNGRPSLDVFTPARMGDGCSGRANESYVLPDSVRVLTWPTTGPGYPAQITADPDSRSLWIGDLKGSPADGSAIERIDISHPAHPSVADRYDIAATNLDTPWGPRPWDILAPPHSRYVYCIDADSTILRIDKANDHVDTVQIPLTSDLEAGFGLALHGGRLYFTLSDDAFWGFGDASTFGYIPLSSWPPDSAPTHGVTYSGLPLRSGNSSSDYRAIAAGRTGELAITNARSVIRLTP